MPLTDDELFQNYFKAVTHYIKQNGGTVDHSKVRLGYNPAEGDGKVINFLTWDYKFSQPTNTELKVYDLADVKTTYRVEENVTQKAGEIANNNLTMYIIKDILKDYHSMSESQANDYITNCYIAFHDL